MGDDAYSAPPLFSAGGVAPPGGAQSFWLDAAAGRGFADGARLRAAYWPPTGAARGAALLFQGRTEFIEKHYEPIERLLGLGFAVFTLDWRGQGLSQRPLTDRRRGHIADFADFQKDVDAALAQMRAVGAPTPWLLVCHSMGGAIGARCLMRAEAGGLAEGARFAAAVLSAPMLGLAGAGGGLTATLGASAASMVGLGGNYLPGGSEKPYSEEGFEGNLLTSDAQRFDRRLNAMIAAHPTLALGGATWGWLRAARREMPRLRPTAIPTLLAIGDQEQVVSQAAAKAYVAAAPQGELLVLEGARHEPFLETDAIQERLWSGVESFLDRCMPRPG